MAGREKAIGSAKLTKAGLQFPVSRIGDFSIPGSTPSAFRAGAPVYLAAVLEYLSAELDSDPYKLSLEPEKKLPVLPNLESFELLPCIGLLDYLPALDILKLTHLDPLDTSWRLDCIE